MLPSSPGQAPESGLQAVLFDFDGTTADCFEDIAQAVNHALVAIGRPELPLPAVVKLVGNGARELVRRALGPDHEHLTDDALKLMQRHYLEHPADHARLYPGIKSMLEALRAQGIRTALVTNKPHAVALLVARHLKLDTLMDTVVGEQASLARKPAPDMLLEACRRLEVAPTQCVMVGDGPMDIEAARRAGMPCVAVLWGICTEQELAACRPAALAHDAAQLPQLAHTALAAAAAILARQPYITE